MSTRQVGSFLIHEELARGHLGVIHRAEHIHTHEPVAVKIVSLAILTPGQHKELETEMRYLMSITSSRVVRLKEYLRTKAYMYLFMEYCAGGSVLTYVMRNGPAPESLARRWLRDVAEGLSDMKRANAMHRDVKLSHILLTSSDESARAKLSGTGFSRFALENTATRSALGTPLFMAPEILRREAYGYKVDVWSLGVTAYWLLLGVEPYQVTTLEQLQAAQQVPITFNKYCTLSSQAQSFVLALVQYLPERRPTYEQILAHPFLQEPQPTVEIAPIRQISRPESVVKEANPAITVPVVPIDRVKEPSPPQTTSFPMGTIAKPTPSKAEEVPTPVPAAKPIPEAKPNKQQIEETKAPTQPLVPLLPSTPSIPSEPVQPAVPLKSPAVAKPAVPIVDPPQLVISRLESPPLTSQNSLNFSLLEMSPLEDEYSFVDISQMDNMLLEGEDCKKLLPLATRFRSVFNIPMARSLCIACKKVFEREEEKCCKLLRGYSMQESYLGALLQAINARLQAVNKELDQLGSGDVARVQDYETEIGNRLAVAPGNSQSQAIYEEIKLLSKAAVLHFPNHAANFAGSYSTSLHALNSQ